MDHYRTFQDMETDAISASWQALARRNTLGDLMRRAARRDPTKVAVHFGSVALTYCEWNQEINRLAHALAREGIRKGDHVGIVGRNSLYFLSVAWAVAKMGAVMVPVNPHLKKEELAYIFDHAGIQAVCADASLQPVIDQALGSSSHNILRLALNGTADGWWDYEGMIRDVPSTEYWESLDDNDVAQILYTSGTESRPKGVMLTHRNCLDQYASIMAMGEFHHDDIVLHALPLHHSAQLNAFFGPFLQLGATHVIAPEAQVDVIMHLIATYQVTEFFAPPTVWIGLLRSPEFSPDRFSSLTKAVYGAAIMPVEILTELHTTLPWVRFWNMYGMTEVAPFATGLGPTEQFDRPKSVGKPGINVEMAILRPDGELAEVGEAGEIAFRTSHALLGYYKDSVRTRAAFAYGWYHTGDVGVIDGEGYLTVIDRQKDMIKTGGENVSSREVEEVLYQHPAVQECAVIGVPHPYWVEAVVALVVLRAEHSVTPSDLVSHCAMQLAGFKVPKDVRIVEALPKNASGKVMKAQLKAEWGEVSL